MLQTKENTLIAMNLTSAEIDTMTKKYINEILYDIFLTDIKLIEGSNWTLREGQNLLRAEIRIAKEWIETEGSFDEYFGTTSN